MNVKPENSETDYEQDHSQDNDSNSRTVFNPIRGMKKPSDLSDRRSPGRTPQEALMCDLGPVLDLSCGGMRILSKRPLSGIVKAKVWAFDFSMTLDTRVAWSNRLGFRRHEIGLEFTNIDEPVSKILGRISALHRMRRAI